MKLNEYSNKIDLLEPYIHGEIFSNKEERDSSLNRLIEYLQKELDDSFEIPTEREKKALLLRGLLNQRAPKPFDRDEKKLLDRLLWTERVEKGIVDINTVPNVWRGDITQLGVDAIVNAANRDMLGCFRPLHACIDNAIHSAAGVQLRQDCHAIMQLQGKKEETGDAKITKAYNLPSRYVLHTVGPIVNGSLTNRHRELLTSCYSSCLDLASQVKDIKSLAFCCISTGVFGYPQEDAAVTAIGAVKKWTEKNPKRFDRIIFNVFKEDDYEIYQRHI